MTDPTTPDPSSDIPPPQDDRPPAVPDDAGSATDHAPTPPSDAALPDLTPPVADIPAVGTVMCGRVAETTDADVFLDVGLTRRAVFPLSQLKQDAPPETGAELPVVVEGYDHAAGVLRVRPSLEPAGDNGAPFKPGTRVEGLVTGMVRGGLEVQIGDYRAFMPASQVDTVRVKDISVFLGQKVVCEVLEQDKTGDRPIVSRRKIVARERAAQRKRLLNQLEEGQKRKGTVVNLTEYGAFVDLGGLRGLLHVGDMRWESVRKPTDVVQLGDEIEILVLSIDKKRKRISIGLKQLTPDPWSGVAEKYPAGTRLSARVSRLSKFGAFAEVDDGVTALIPLSELSWQRRGIKLEDIVTVGQPTDVIVAAVDEKKRRLTLSIKRLTEDPWARVSECCAPGSVIPVTVRTLLDFGAIVEVKDGVEGMIHISELSSQRVGKTGDVVNPGDQIDVKILSIDPEKRRISLSLKQASEPTPPAPAETAAPTRKPQKRRRGGLDAHFDF